MDDEQAEAICDELRRLISLGPGTNGSALNRARSILSQFASSASDYIRGKASEVGDDFQLWFTPRRWRKFGDELSFRARLNGSIEKLSIALSSHHGK
jgi:hypothetical protein